MASPNLDNLICRESVLGHGGRWRLAGTAEVATYFDPLMTNKSGNSLILIGLAHNSEVRDGWAPTIFGGG